MNKNTFFLLTATIAILTMVAGCASSPTTTPVTVPTTSTPDPSLTPTIPPVTVAPTPPPSDGTRALVAAETDATWVLYANKALGYTVNTPTKGKYAPTWEMKYVDQSDSHISRDSIEGGGCYFIHINPTPSNEFVGDTVRALDGTKFCHTKSEFGDPPSFFVIDDYATAVGESFIVIEFTKVTTNASVFVASDYQTTLDGIMGTFQMNTASTPVTTTQKSLKEYFATRNQFLNSEMPKESSGDNVGMDKNPEALGFKELAQIEVTCPDSAGTPCGGDLLILSKDPIRSGNQEFYLAFTMGFGYEYYGPFTDDLQRIVNESKTIDSLAK